MTELKEVADTLRDLNVKEALSVAFGKCPEHGERLVAGHWLKWCPRRECRWHAPK